MNHWERGFALAREASLKSNGIYPCKRMGSSLFAGSRLLSTGSNVYLKSHPKFQFEKFNTSIHAELSALVKRQHYEDRNLILYVYRQSANGSNACSRPCARCMSILKYSNVKRIRFHNEEGLPTEIRL